MSYTSIIAFDSAGHMIDDPLGEIQNSWRSAPAIWRYLEKTHLPPYFPSWVSEEERAEGIEKFVLRHGYEPSRCALVDADAFQEIIDLAYNVNYSGLKSRA